MRHANRWGSVGLLTAVLGVAACGSDRGGAPEQGSKTNPAAGVSEEKSDLARLPPDAPSTDVARLVADDTDFALALFEQLPADENLILSPESISTALAMLYPGAAGTTKSEMQSALHFAQPDAELNGAFNTLDQALASRGSNANGTQGRPFRLKVSNALWGQRAMALLPGYLDVLAQNYGAGINTVDFVNNPELARENINAWVSDQTAQKIPELLQEGMIASDTRLVLTNAVYFNAAWAAPFEASATTDMPFSALDGSSVSVPVMHADARGAAYAESADYQALEMPYDGYELSLLVILPTAGTFASLRTGLAANLLAAIDAGEQLAAVELSLPRFAFSTSVSLPESLRALGMNAAFSPAAADLSGIDGSRDLYVSEVVHQAFISVDEAGTEAAAATALTGSATSDIELEKKVFDARRPFLFAIRDNATKAVLFWGQLVNPHG